MDARVIGPASELGQFETLTFYGHDISKDWAKIEPSEAVLTKLQGNRYVELREGRKKPSDEAPIDTVTEITARLTELGVEFDPKAKKADLAELLTAAEAAHAAQQAEQTEA